uniref:Uncharacterized protein n=1 Tax=viral metagenome TaxID=1070528 RepID=A0A6M3IS45_9ZZZZ
MKPVENKVKACFKLGHIYRYIGDSDADDEGQEFGVVRIKTCSNTWCSKIEGSCDHTIAYDEHDNEWCGIYDDFEEE